MQDQIAANPCQTQHAGLPPRGPGPQRYMPPPAWPQHCTCCFEVSKLRPSYALPNIQSAPHHCQHHIAQRPTALQQAHARRCTMSCCLETVSHGVITPQGDHEPGFGTFAKKRGSSLATPWVC